MNLKRKAEGFSLIELLLVLAILGIISAIAIPSFMGQRRRARIVGDARSNAATLRMLLETRKADNGVYGPASQEYKWTYTSSPSASTNPAPTFVVSKATTGMNYTVKVGATGLTYDLTVTDTSLGNATVYKTDQTGANLFTLQ